MNGLGRDNNRESALQALAAGGQGTKELLDPRRGLPGRNTGDFGAPGPCQHALYVIHRLKYLPVSF